MNLFLFVFSPQGKSSVANLPATGYSNFRFINTVPCDINLYSDSMKKKNLSVGYHEVSIHLLHIINLEYSYLLQTAGKYRVKGVI